MIDEARSSENDSVDFLQSQCSLQAREFSIVLLQGRLRPSELFNEYDFVFAILEMPNAFRKFLRIELYEYQVEDKSIIRNFDEAVEKYFEDEIEKHVERAELVDQNNRSKGHGYEYWEDQEAEDFTFSAYRRVVHVHIEIFRQNNRDFLQVGENLFCLRGFHQRVNHVRRDGENHEQIQKTLESFTHLDVRVVLHMIHRQEQVGSSVREQKSNDENDSNIGFVLFPWTSRVDIIQRKVLQPHCLENDGMRVKHLEEFAVHQHLSLNNYANYFNCHLINGTELTSSQMVANDFLKRTDDQIDYLHVEINIV